MTRAIPVDDEFDPVPSLIAVRAIDVSVASAIPDDVGSVVELVPTSPQRADQAILEAVGFTGALGDVHVVTGPPATVLIGIGANPLGLASGRDIGAAAAGAIPGALELAIDVGNVDAEVAQGIVEGIILARYSWDALRSAPARRQVNSITLVSSSDAVAAGARRGHLKALATAVSRDLANCPPAHLTAVRWAAIAERAAPEFGLDVEIRDRDWLLAERCGGIIAVNGGSDEEPRLITLTYTPDEAVANGRHVVLVGKGLTYDSGGLAIKPGDVVHAMMKNDMSGGGAVFASMLVLRDLQVPTKVTAHIMCTDNMPSGTAMKMGDVITHRDGTTVEILNTDAEGRLIMADAIVMGTEIEPDAIIDIATLTGAAMRALGTDIAGVMGTDQALVELIKSAGEATGEPVWQLPMGATYRAELDSDVADLKNLGGMNAGASTAAEFLAHFAKDVPWVHIDIAGVAATASPKGWKTRGMSGFGARLLVDTLERFT
ncbi:MAG TPA: leucyl aminopeptidase family protein [Ilumatobacteraceae bacterium]|nr:leucyl aminopeptidase family protein [Ilumatobacteraceae bacterium]